MNKILKLPLVAFAFLVAPLSAEDRLSPGIWTNTEDEYFAEEEGRERPDWLGFEVSDDGRWRSIDAFRQPLGDWQEGPIPNLASREDGGWQVDNSELRKAREFFCWISVLRSAEKPGGGEDWSFVRNLPNFDQGGRIFVPGEGLAPDVTIRLRNVTWAKGSRNKPALVLYVHTEDPVRAVSYSWASSDASMVGINLRWVQASCSRSPSQTERS